MGAVAFWALGNAFSTRGRELWLMGWVGRDWSGVSDAAGCLIEKHSATSTEGLGLAERWTQSSLVTELPFWGFYQRVGHKLWSSW